MAFSAEQVASLSAKLDKAAVKSRTQAGRQLSYIEGWHAIAEANRIFGYAEWDRALVSIKLLGEPRLVEGKHRVGYMATVRITVRAGDCVVVRDGTGFGSGIDRDVDQAHESALKEAETDAMKRALMTFGNPFGLALYDKKQEGVADVAAASNGTRADVSAPVKFSDLAEDMIARLKGVETVGQLITLAKGEAWKSDIDKLDHSDYAEVRARYGERQAALGGKTERAA